VGGVTVGAVRPDATAVRETAEILEMAEQSGDDLSLASARSLHGFVLAQQTGPDRDRGLALLAVAREAVTQGRSLAAYLSSIDCEFATERALRGDVDGAIQALQSIVEAEIASGGLGTIGCTTESLAELLLRRGRPADIEAAREAIDRAAAVPTEAGVVIYDLPLLRLRALLARACGDEVEYRRHRDRYRALANEVGFEGHMAKAETMP
jgi:adenylate cyclase